MVMYPPHLQYSTLVWLQDTPHMNWTSHGIFFSLYIYYISICIIIIHLFIQIGQTYSIVLTEFNNVDFNSTSTKRITHRRTWHGCWTRVYLSMCIKPNMRWSHVIVSNRYFYDMSKFVLYLFT